MRDTNTDYPRMLKPGTTKFGSKKLEELRELASEYPQYIPEHYVQGTFEENLKKIYFLINETDILSRATDIEGTLDYFPYYHKGRHYVFVNETTEAKISSFHEVILRLYYRHTFRGTFKPRSYSGHLFLANTNLPGSTVMRDYFTDQNNRFQCYTNMKSRSRGKKRKTEVANPSPTKLIIRTKCDSAFYMTFFKDEILTSEITEHTSSICV